MNHHDIPAERRDDPFVLWGKRLLEDAGNALDAIVTGRGGRGVQQRAEVDEFLADLLAIRSGRRSSASGLSSKWTAR